MKSLLKWSVFFALCAGHAQHLRSPFMHQIILSHTEPGGIGYNDGYTTAGLLLIPKIYPRGYCFLQGQFHCFDNGSYASNLGFCTRGMTKQHQITYGINMFYDNRYHHHLFHQIGCGLEVQKNPLVFKVNAYFSLGAKSHIVHFQQYNYEAGYQIRQNFADVVFPNHWDSEVGCFLSQHPNKLLYFGLGPYMLSAYTPIATTVQYFGGLSRLSFTWNKMVKIEARVSHDSLFKTRVQGEISLTIPLGYQRKSLWDIHPVIRESIIPLRRVNYWSWNY